jgi:hypothetical protein
MIGSGAPHGLTHVKILEATALGKSRCCREVRSQERGLRASAHEEFESKLDFKFQRSQEG